MPFTRRGQRQAFAFAKFLVMILRPRAHRRVAHHTAKKKRPVKPGRLTDLSGQLWAALTSSFLRILLVLATRESAACLEVLRRLQPVPAVAGPLWRRPQMLSRRHRTHRILSRSPTVPLTDSPCQGTKQAQQAHG